MYDLDEELLEEFISECMDMLDDVEPTMLSASCLDKSLADKLFRPIHSVKGSSASLGFNVLAKSVHAAETLLTLFRDKGYVSNEPAYLTCFLNFFDFIRNILNQLMDSKTDEEFSEEGSALQVNAEKLAAKLIEGGAADTEDTEKAKVAAEPEVVAEAEVEPEPEVVVELEGENVEEEEAVVELGPEMIELFVSEAGEGFTIIEDCLLKLVSKPDDSDSLEEAFRAVHSFKGNCGIFSLRDLEKLSHRIENVFQKVLDGGIKAEIGVFDTILPLLDVLKNEVKGMMDSPPGDLVGLELYLEILDGLDTTDEAESAGLVIEKPKLNLEVEQVVEVKAEVKPKAEKIEPIQKKTSVKAKSVAARQSIRVDVAKLDILNDLVGELVTVKTMVGELKKYISTDDDNIAKIFRYLDRVTNDLHDSAMNIRMIPIEGLFKKMIRIVHDISSKSGKQVNFEYSGEDTEIDKTLVEKINDPLVHMIRNAVDHGVESESERLEASHKPAMGTVKLSARHDAGEVQIIVEDDGKGLDREKLLAKAISQNLCQGDGSDLSDDEVFKFLFHGGFSTAEKVTDISGRGVGMDVVRRNIESLKGKIDIKSTLGEGTKFIIRIPLTLAIIKGMLVKVGESFYSIPIENVRESIKVKKEDIVRPMDGRELVSVRGEMLPVLRLSEFYNVKDAIFDIDEAIVVVVEGHSKKMAILVDALLGQKETVVKPVPSYFKSIPGIAGCSIMGNGDASLILDTGTMISHAMMKDKVN